MLITPIWSILENFEIKTILMSADPPGIKNGIFAPEMLHFIQKVQNESRYA